MKRNRKEVVDILEDVYTVNLDETVQHPTTSGFLSRYDVERYKENFLHRAIKFLAEDLVDGKKHYPKNKYVDLDLKTSFVIVPTNEFRKVKKYIEDNE